MPQIHNFVQVMTLICFRTSDPFRLQIRPQAGAQVSSCVQLVAKKDLSEACGF